MVAVDYVLGCIDGVLERLSTPLWSQNAGHVVSNVVAPKGWMSQERVTTIAKAALAMTGLSCMAAGVVLTGRALMSTCSVRNQVKQFQPQSLIPKSEGQKELISGSVSILPRIKAVVMNKLLPASIGIAGFAGGVFILAHMDQFANAFKKS